MKIVIAMDSFKGGLPAGDACHAVAEGLLDADSTVECVIKPMADGGEGTASALLACIPGGQWVKRRVTGPLPGMTVEAGFGWFPSAGMAVIEMAEASGITLLDDARRNPMLTTTYGTGELIAEAVGIGAKRILLGIGGSATVDGGTGAASALGWRFLDSKGGVLHCSGGVLKRISRIEPPAGGVAELPVITVLSDVKNTLCGAEGAAAVFGPQKGATPGMVELLDRGLMNLAMRVKADTGRDVLDLPGGGAAGGLGAGAVAFLNASIISGISAVMEASGLADSLAGADWCITGEGSFDNQSLAGKVVKGVADKAHAAGVPVVVFAGRVDVDRALCRENGIHEAIRIQEEGMELMESIKLTSVLLRRRAAAWLGSVGGGAG